MIRIDINLDEVDMLFNPGAIILSDCIENMYKEGDITLQDVEKLIIRHITGDDGNLEEEDHNTNVEAIKNNERILSHYKLNGNSIYVITEWDRSITTVLLTKEY